MVNIFQRFFKKTPKLQYILIGMQGEVPTIIGRRRTLKEAMDMDTRNEGYDLSFIVDTQEEKIAQIIARTQTQKLANKMRRQGCKSLNLIKGDIMEPESNTAIWEKNMQDISALKTAGNETSAHAYYPHIDQLSTDTKGKIPNGLAYIPEGYQATGEFRIPTEGEYYLDGKVVTKVLDGSDIGTYARIIVKRNTMTAFFKYIHNNKQAFINYILGIPFYQWKSTANLEITARQLQYAGWNFTCHVSINQLGGYIHVIYSDGSFGIQIFKQTDNEIRLNKLIHNIIDIVEDNQHSPASIVKQLNIELWKLTDRVGKLEDMTAIKG